MCDIAISDSDTEDIDIKELMKKYTAKQPEELEKQNYENICNISVSDEEISNLVPLRDKLEFKNQVDINTIQRKAVISEDSDDVLLSQNDCDSIQNKAKKNKSDNNDKLLKKQQKEQEKLQKKAEKEKIKAENLKAKQLKQNMMQAYKNLKPEECIKYITVVIDSELISMECGAEIPTILQTANISYRVKQQNIPNIITWIRKTETQLDILNSEFKLTNNEDNCPETMLLIMWNDFVRLVHKKNLLSDIQMKQSILPNNKLILCIYGLEGYFSYLKQKKSQTESQRTSKNSIYKEAPKISRNDVDMALIEVQIFLDISHRMLEKPQDVGNVVAQFSKSIAQIPYRQLKQQKYEQMEWYIPGDNKDCVRVNKDGNGLFRLWQQQLTQFSLARLETAEAISSKYPSPLCLMEAYDKCETKEEGEKLLQDIPIRRAAGPLTNVRKIGPELSKKIYTLFTSTDGNTIL